MSDCAIGVSSGFLAAATAIFVETYLRLPFYRNDVTSDWIITWLINIQVVAEQTGNKIERSTCCLFVARSTKSTVLNSNLLLVCTGLSTYGCSLLYDVRAYLAALTRHSAVMVPGSSVTAYNTRVWSVLRSHVARYVWRAWITFHNTHRQTLYTHPLVDTDGQKHAWQAPKQYPPQQ